MFPVTSNLDFALAPLVEQGVPFVVIDEHPEYSGTLVFQTMEDESVFYERYHDWVSRYLVLSQLFNLGNFVDLLFADGYQVFFAPSAKKVLDDFERWSAPLDIEGYDLHPFQTFSLNMALERSREGRTNTDRLYLWNWAPGAGKAAPLSEPVLTPSGWRTMGDLQLGDQVIGSNGGATAVVAIHPQGVQPVWRVEFSDKTFVRCNADHLWNVRKAKARVRHDRGGVSYDPPWKTMTTREIAASMPESGQKRWQVPPLGQVQYLTPVYLPVDPYLLGVLLGDGCFRGNSIHTDKEIIDFFGWNRGKKETEHTVVACIPAPVKHALMDMGLWWQYSHEKHVPDVYLTASPAHRMALLQGLLDTDGHAYGTKTGVEFSTTSERLRDQVADLVRGLCGRATVSQGRVTNYTAADGSRVPGRQSWRISIVFPPDVMPFRLSRKAEAYQPPVQRKTPTKFIANIVEENVSEDQACITVDAPDGLYVTRGHNVTHNSFSCAAGAKALFDSDDIDIVIAATLNSFKGDLLRFFEHSGLDAVINDGTKAKRQKVYREEHQVYVMNFEKLRTDTDELSELTRNRRPLFILDEAHYLLAEEGHNKTRTALDELVKEAHSTVWPLTATPVNGSALKFRDAFSLDAFPRSNPLGTKKDFVDKYARSVKKVTLKGRHGGRWDLTTYDWDHSALHEVRHRVGDRTVAVRKTDPGVRERFKGLQCLEEWVEMTDELHAVLETIREDGRRARDAGESRAPHVLAARIASVFPPALRHSQNEVAQMVCERNPSALTAAGSNKIAVVNDMLAGIQDAGDQALLFCHWTSMGIRPLAKHLKVPHVLHYGVGLTQEQRQSVKDKFKADPDITAFLTSDAGSHGISMQNARYVISLDPPYSYDLLTQRNSRIDRADSHLDGLTGYVLLTRDNPTEERIWEVCDQRRRLSESVQGTHESLSYGDIDNEPGSTSLDWILGLEQ